MAQKIFNLGRVLGYSTYELYVKQTLNNNETPMSEAAWITCQQGQQASMIVHITPYTWSSQAIGYQSVAVSLPANSLLRPYTALTACLSPYTVSQYSGNWAVNASVPSNNDLQDLDERILSYSLLSDAYMTYVSATNQWVVYFNTRVPGIKFANAKPFDLLISGFRYKDSINLKAASTNPENGDFLGPTVGASRYPIIFTGATNTPSINTVIYQNKIVGADVALGAETSLGPGLITIPADGMLLRIRSDTPSQQTVTISYLPQSASALSKTKTFTTNMKDEAIFVKFETTPVSLGTMKVGTSDSSDVKYNYIIGY